MRRRTDRPLAAAILVGALIGSLAGVGHADEPSAPSIEKLDQKSKERLRRAACSISASFNLPLQGRSSSQFARKALARHDKNGDQVLSRKEVRALLRRAKIGNSWTRGAWTKGLLKQIDADRSGGLTSKELEAGYVQLCLAYRGVEKAQAPSNRAEPKKKGTS